MPGKVESWVIALSVIGGILLFMLLTMALFKSGILQRKQRDELQTLKEQVSY